MEERLVKILIGLDELSNYFVGLGLIGIIISGFKVDEFGHLLALGTVIKIYVGVTCDYD